MNVTLELVKFFVQSLVSLNFLFLFLVLSVDLLYSINSKYFSLQLFVLFSKKISPSKRKLKFNEKKKFNLISIDMMCSFNSDIIHLSFFKLKIDLENHFYMDF